MVKFQTNTDQPTGDSSPSYQHQENGDNQGKSQQEIEDEIFREHHAISERTPLLAAKNNVPLYSAPAQTRSNDSGADSTPTQSSTPQQPPEIFKITQKWWRELSSTTKWVIIVAIIFLIQLFFFIFSLKIVAPITTRNAIEQSEISFDSVRVENSGSSFAIVGNATINNLGKVKVTSDPTDLSVYYLGNLLGNIALPAMTLSPQDNQFFINSTLRTYEPALLEGFVADTILKDSLEWDIQGFMNFYSKAATLRDYSLNKKIQFTGFNGAKEIQLRSLNLYSDNFDHGVGFTADLSFWNPSNITLLPGNLAFGLFYENLLIAEGNSADPVLTPGDNDLVLSGSLSTISDDAAHMTEFLNKYFKGDVLNVEVRGLGSASAHWLDKALQHVQTEVEVQGIPEPVYITEMSITDPSVEFDGQEYTLGLNGVLNANLKLPTTFKTLPIRIRQTSQVCVYRFEACVPFAALDVPSSAILTTAEEDFTSMKAELSDVQLVALPDAQDEYSQVLQDFFTSKNLIFQVTGHTIITAETAIGLLDLELDSFTEFVDVKGLSSLQHPPINVTSVEMSSSSEGLTFESVVALHSESSILLRLGPVVLDLMYEEVKIGEAWIPDLEISPGDNNIVVYSQLINPDTAPLNETIGELFSKHLQGVDIPLRVQGNSRSSLIEPLNQVLQHYVHPFTIPGRSGNLIEGTAFHLFFGSISTQITNPINTLPLKIRVLNATLSMEDSKIGEVNLRFREGSWFSPINIPPNRSLRTPRLPVSFTEDGAKKLRAHQGGEVELDIQSKVEVEINKMPIHVTYNVSHIIAKVNSWFFSE
ncbi:hypothetical protein K493DRAFT_310642 [Basidiobolus meristosporus CBS 931.73]|uniref:Tag1-like fifth Ig-like domain-containing protein n=1 Tax=Basidiobolus meristosporus CBS 931.73 TaxID=1314790 RepID=A0A1Y1Z7R5_9FUNG|nr:hypothetical protein K493DRAFT_310642 [Basidiobolus meristosporus CBS 931.73]|eukprot:ORY06310.1 hypothetical protein K493DRAFT_310642 [Basidiobolus meristosporus CBS 931.73]